MRLAGLEPVAAICEVMAEDGTMARMPALEQFAQKHGIGIVTIADLIAYRQWADPGIRRGPGTRLPTGHGEFMVTAYDNALYSDIDLALTMGDVASGEPVLVRFHSECLTGDVFGSRRCDCGEQLRMAMEQIAREGRGILLYLRQEGRGIGLRNKLKAYALQDQGLDTIEANEHLGFPVDLRTFGPAVRMLKDLEVSKVRLLTNNPRKIAAFPQQGIEVVERVPIMTRETQENSRYLNAKRDKLGHLLRGSASGDALSVQ